MSWSRNLSRQIRRSFSDKAFLGGLKIFESLVSKFLSIAMVMVILVTLVDLSIFLIQKLFLDSLGFFKEPLTEIFGLFLSILIALEILENITAYLRKHVVQVELVIVTSLTAVARKIIILDLEKVSGVSLIGLAIAILSLSISYWIVRNMQPRAGSS
ncbi:MAG: phosphate-starvation-inducible PsiE family protein [Cyanothece sp. SIO1E1]|nr:phosphate-starvation-inducible PsiE family protein [Cyanothece sp. SIO1E1]